MSDLLQFKRLTSATVMQTFTVDGTPIDLDSGVPTVTITRPDGTTIASGTVSGAWAGPPARTTGQYRFVLAGQPEVTVLDVTWTGTVGGQPQTLQSTVEIVGAHLFTEAAMRALKVAGGTPFAATATPLFTDQQIMDARAATLDEFQQILGFSPVPRFMREILNGDGRTSLSLPGLMASRILSVTINGVAKTATDYQISSVNEIEAISNYGYGAAFPSGRRNVTVEWVAGWDRVMGEGSNFAMVHTAAVLDPGISSSASTVTTPDGVSYTFDAAGQVTRAGHTRHFGTPNLDSWLNRWAARIGVA
jgi:hypothetical protein